MTNAQQLLSQLKAAQATARKVAAELDTKSFGTGQTILMKIELAIEHTEKLIK